MNQTLPTQPVKTAWTKRGGELTPIFHQLRRHP